MGPLVFWAMVSSRNYLDPLFLVVIIVNACQFSPHDIYQGWMNSGAVK